MKPLKFCILPVPGLVFFPNTIVPIDITDPIYISMVSKAIEQGIPIVIVPSHEYIFPENIFSFGMPILLEESSCERLKIVLEGKGKIILHTVLQNLPYPIWDGYQIFDNSERTTLVHKSIEKLHQIFDNWIYQSIPNSIERENFVTQIKTIQQITDYISMFLVKDIDVKLMLLKSHSLYERVQILSLLLNDVFPYLENSNIVRILKIYEHLEHLQHEYVKAV